MKHIKENLKLLKDYFRGRTTYVDNPGGMTMQHIGDEGSKDIRALLGISDERGEELLNLLVEQVKKDDKHKTRACIDSIVTISKYCKHQNELGYIAYIGGKLCEQLHGNPILSVLRMAGGRIQEE